MRKISKICPVCGKTFSVPYCHRKRYQTCGHKCGGVYRQKPIVTNICKNCKTEFVSKKHPKSPQTFCSRICALKNRRKCIERHCKECHKSFFVSPYLLKISGGGTYCSNKCRLQNWNRESLKRQCHGSYRENAWKVFEKKCAVCGISDERLIIIHHKDGNRKNGLIENLIPLCQNCHCLAHIELTGESRLPSVRRH